MDEIKSTYSPSQFEPSSLLGWSLLRKKVFSHLMFWIASASLISRAFYRFSIVVMNKEVETMTKYGQLLNQLCTLCLGLTIMHFEFNRPLYIKYLDCYQTIVNNNFGKASLKFVNKWGKIVRVWVIFAFLYELITIATFEYLYIFKKTGFTANMFLLVSFFSFTQLLYILTIQFIIECCIYTQSTFIPINTLLDTLLHQNQQSTQLDINRMAKLTRVHYTKIIKSIRYIDKFLTYAILVFYLYFIGHCIFVFNEFFQVSGSIYWRLYNVFRFFGESSYLVLTTYHLVRVHQLSVQMFAKVYDLSYSLASDSFEAVNEINLFLFRIDRNDVGFTFAGLCLVSPSFVSSLASIALTLGLALPNFID
uniref:Gustatory receptor n=2 Tax=Tetranychus urticae TaxID=32264 RepID=T1KRK4_TETUR